MKNPKSVVITGASSGLGAALALEYAAPGVVLGLTGRDAVRLQAVAEQCQAKGAVVVSSVVSVTEREALRHWLLTFDAAHPVELVIANAGISAGTGSGGEDESQAREIFATNVDGVLNTLFPLVAPMKGRGRGQLAIMASLAGFRGFPGAPAYCASKAAVRVYGEALRGELLPHGVNVSVICPGYVRTPMTAINDFWMPNLMNADNAARLMKARLAKGQARIAYPIGTYALVRLIAALPASWMDAILRHLPRKPSVAKGR